VQEKIAFAESTHDNLPEIPVYEIREERIIKRDNITKEKFLERENASLEFNSDDFDEVINNTGNIEREGSKIYEKSIISREF